MSRSNKKIAPAPQSFVVMSEAKASNSGWLLGTLAAMLIIALLSLAMLYKKYDVLKQAENIVQQDQQAVEDVESKLKKAHKQLIQAQRWRAELKQAQQQLLESQESLDILQQEKQALENEMASRVDPATVTLPAVGLDIASFEILGEGERRDFRLNLLRTHSVDPNLPKDAAIKLRAAEGPNQKGSIRLVLVPKADPDKRIYVPKGSWKRDKGYPLGLRDGHQEIRELLEMPEGGLKTVRVEVMVYQPEGGYTLIRRVFNKPAE